MMAHISLFWAGSLRESWEEMGLLPWKVEYLGVLEPYRLSLFDRKILPMVGWIKGQGRFRPNWEVARIVPIPVLDLIAPHRYGRFRIRNHPRAAVDPGGNVLPCYLHEDGDGREVLWGATYHIVESFLERVLGFRAPDMEGRPLVEGELAENYLTGSLKKKGV